MKCEGCWHQGVDEDKHITVRLTNGALVLCQQCLDDFNRKNPRMLLLESALKRIQEWDCLNPPVPDSDFPWLKRLVEDALAGVKSW